MHTITYGPATGRLPENFAQKLAVLGHHAHAIRAAHQGAVWQEMPEYQAVMRAIDAVADEARNACPHLFRGMPC